MIFQSLDDKNKCIGVYTNGALHFDNLPTNLTKTWKYTGSLKDREVEYAWIYADGQSLDEVCPEEIKDEWERLQRKMRAYKKSFDIGKIDFREHCFFDLVPHDFLVEFCEARNQITQDVFDTLPRPDHYSHLEKVDKLLYKIKYQNLNISTTNTKALLANSTTRYMVQRLLQSPKYINYNLFGTATGRLTTYSRSFPMLTLRKDLRQLIKPHNDWFLSLDYNGAEVRTLMGLLKEEQPQKDIHNWNIRNIFKRPRMTRDEAKTEFFGWLYNDHSTVIKEKDTCYDRGKALKMHYKDGYIHTIFGRHIEVDHYRALNYLLQSTTADLVLDRAVAIDEVLKDRESFISHIVHDEIIIDFCSKDRDLVHEIRDLFSENKLGKFVVNLKAGQNYQDLEIISI